MQSNTYEPFRNNMSLYSHFVMAPYAIPAVEMIMLLIYRGLVSITLEALHYLHNQTFLQDTNFF